MKKTNSLFLSAVFCAAVLCGTGCKNNRTEKAVTGAAGTFTMVTVQEKTKYADINVQYPQFPGYAPLNKIISRSILGPYKDFRSTVKQGWTEMNDIRSGSGTDAGMPPFSYDVVCKPVIYNDRYISMLFITYAMEGGAHGDTTLSSFTYDRKRNTIVSIKRSSRLLARRTVGILRRLFYKEPELRRRQQRIPGRMREMDRGRNRP